MPIDRNTGIGPGVPSQPDPGKDVNKRPSEEPRSPDTTPDQPAPTPPPQPAPIPPQTPVQTPSTAPAVPPAPMAPPTPAPRPSEIASIVDAIRGQAAQSLGGPEPAPAQDAAPTERGVTPSEGVRPVSETPFMVGGRGRRRGTDAFDKANLSPNPQSEPESTPPTQDVAPEAQPVEAPAEQPAAQPARQAAAPATEEPGPIDYTEAETAAELKAQEEPEPPEAAQADTPPTIEQLNALSYRQVANMTDSQMLRASAVMAKAIQDGAVDANKALKWANGGISQVGRHPYLLVMKGFALGKRSRRSHKAAIDTLANAVMTPELYETRVLLGRVVMANLTSESAKKALRTKLDKVWQSRTQMGQAPRPASVMEETEEAEVSDVTEQDEKGFKPELHTVEEAQPAEQPPIEDVDEAAEPTDSEMQTAPAAQPADVTAEALEEEGLAAAVRADEARREASAEDEVIAIVEETNRIFDETGFRLADLTPEEENAILSIDLTYSGQSISSARSGLELMRKTARRYLTRTRGADAADAVLGTQSDETEVTTDVGAQTELAEDVDQDWVERQRAEVNGEVELTAEEEAAQEEVFHAAERAALSDKLEDMVDYLEAKLKKDRLSGQEAEWLNQARIRIEQLADPDISLTLFELSAMEEKIAAVVRLIEDDAVRAAQAEAEKDEKLRKQAEERAAERSKNPRNWYRVLKARALNKTNIDAMRFEIEGDTEIKQKVTVSDENNKPRQEERTVIEHSDEVERAIERTLYSLGYNDPAQYASLERFLYLAVMLYRGIGVDREGNMPVVTDVDFIKALDEMVANISSRIGHPFAYQYQHSQLAGRLRYPLPMTPELADFFMENGKAGNPNEWTQRSYIAFTVDQWNEKVLPQMMRVADGDQVKSMLDMLDVIAEMHPEYQKMGEGIHAREPDDVATADEKFNLASEYAKLKTTTPVLEDTVYKMRMDAARAHRRMHRRKKSVSGGRSATADRTMDVLNNFLRAVEIAGIFNGIAFRPSLMMSGAVEHLTSIWDVSGATKRLQKIVQKRVDRRAKRDGTESFDVRPSDAFRQEMTQKAENVAAIFHMHRLVNSEGWEGLHNAAAEGETFGEQDVKTADKGDESVFRQIRKRLQMRFGNTEHMIFTLSTSDWVGHRKTAAIWLDYLCIAMSEAGENGRLPVTPEQLEKEFRESPEEFFRTYAQTPEGKSALAQATKTSLAQFNLWTNMMRSTFLRNRVFRVAFGALVTWYPKFHLNIILRWIPGTTTATMLAKEGFNWAWVKGAKFGQGNIFSENAVEEAESWTRETDLYIAGGHHTQLKRRLQEAIITDLYRFRSTTVTFGILMAIVHILGVEPPDDDEDDPAKFFRYDEWYIGGDLVSANWFWSDMLGFVMPAIIALHASAYAAENPDKGYGSPLEVAWRVFSDGMYITMENNAWVRMTGVADIITGFNRDFVTAVDRAEGFDDDIEKGNFFAMQIRSFAIRRAIATFEPAFIRDIYNESGLFGGQPHMDRSTSKVYVEGYEEGEIATDMNPSYADAQLRRALKYSPGAGFIANLATGYYQGNPDEIRTGYMFHQMPLLTNVEPFSQMWVDRLNVYTEDDKIVEFDQKRPEVYDDVVDTVIGPDGRGGLLQHSPQELRGSGVVIPYNARLAADYRMGSEIADLWSDFYARKAEGEWIVKGGFDADKIIEAKLDEQRVGNAIREMESHYRALKDRLWSDEIPYGAWKMGRHRTRFRPVAYYKEGHPKEGQPASLWAQMYDPENIEVKIYATGEHPSSWLPWLTVDDRGDRSFDARAQVPWQNEFTMDEFVENEARNWAIQNGLGSGEDLHDVLTGGGATGIDPTKPNTGGWNTDEYLFPSRAYLPLDEKPKDIEVPEWDFSEAKDGKPPAFDDGGGGWKSWGGWGGGGGSSYTPRIYSKVFGVRADKAAGLYSKTPQYARFDYLRPEFSTKGSREAYRRRDF